MICFQCGIPHSVLLLEFVGSVSCKVSLSVYNHREARCAICGMKLIAATCMFSACTLVWLWWCQPAPAGVEVQKPHNWKVQDTVHHSSCGKHWPMDKLIWNQRSHLDRHRWHSAQTNSSSVQWNQNVVFQNKHASREHGSIDLKNVCLSSYFSKTYEQIVAQRSVVVAEVPGQAI